MNLTTKTLVVILIAFALSACASPSRQTPFHPVVDLPAGSDRTTYYRDIQECNALSEQRLSAGQGAVAGMVIGALLGAAIGRAAGSDFVGYGARMGAISGGVGGATGAAGGREGIVKNCMAGRGWRVLG